MGRGAGAEVVEVDGVEHLVRTGPGEAVAAHQRVARGVHVLPGTAATDTGWSA